MKQIVYFFLCLILLPACLQTGGQKNGNDLVATDSTRYATGFTIQHYQQFTVVEIMDPWGDGRLLQRYILVERTKPIPGNLPQGTIVRTPIRNIVVYTSVHASILDQLGQTDQIIGVCEPRYIDTPAVQEGISSGRIADLGEATSPNIEKIIDIGAEVIIASPFQNTGYGQAEKLGIPIIEGADYMEQHPLARAEWGRFYGLLTCQQEKADSIFKGTEERYLALKELAATATNKPTVFSEKRYGSFWYIPNGDSYTAHFFKDAGANYLFKHLPGSGSTPLAFETVLDEAIHAEFWLMKYNQAQDWSYKDLRTEYTPYENFDAFKNRNIFTCNTGVVPYYEEFPVHPDYLLKDLIKIFHPELLPDYELRYYKPMDK